MSTHIGPKEQELQDVLNRKLHRANQRLAEFALRLRENPAHALEWSREAFEDAANIHIAKCVLKWIGAGKTIDQIKEQTLRLILDGSEFPPSSTSQPSNLMHTQITATWSKLHSTLTFDF